MRTNLNTSTASTELTFFNRNKELRKGTLLWM